MSEKILSAAELRETRDTYLNDNIAFYVFKKYIHPAWIEGKDSVEIDPKEESYIPFTKSILSGLASFYGNLGYRTIWWPRDDSDSGLKGYFWISWKEEKI